MGFKNELEIDHTALDIEWLEQPGKFFAVSEDLAEARTGLDRLKLSLEVIEAELDISIRGNPEEYGLAKITETLIKNVIASNEKVIDMKREIIDAKHDVDILSSAVSAFEHRKRALEHMVTLHGQSYFAGPKAPRDLDTEYIRDTEKKASRPKRKRKKKEE